jgi:hypothetical protein
VPTLEPVPDLAAGSASSALLVPVPAADWLLPGPAMPAHVTLLNPFAPPAALTDGVVGELAALFADVVPFSFTLDEVCTFPTGTVYLAPDPSAPFRQLTAELARRFPEYPPYCGGFDEIVPHVAIPSDEETALRATRARLAGHGSVVCHASEAQLVLVGDGSQEVVATFGFGLVAA